MDHNICKIDPHRTATIIATAWDDDPAAQQAMDTYGSGPVILTAMIGVTNCCGSQDIWSGSYFNGDILIEVLRHTLTSVFVYHCVDAPPTNVYGTTLTANIGNWVKAFNEKYEKQGWKFHWQSLNRWEQLFLMDVKDESAFVKWRSELPK